MPRQRVHTGDWRAATAASSSRHCHGTGGWSTEATPSAPPPPRRRRRVTAAAPLPPCHRHRGRYRCRTGLCDAAPQPRPPLHGGNNPHVTRSTLANPGAGQQALGARRMVLHAPGLLLCNRVRNPRDQDLGRLQEVVRRVCDRLGRILDHHLRHAIQREATQPPGSHEVQRGHARCPVRPRVLG